MDDRLLCGCGNDASYYVRTTEQLCERRRAYYCCEQCKEEFDNLWQPICFERICDELVSCAHYG